MLTNQNTDCSSQKTVYRQLYVTLASVFVGLCILFSGSVQAGVMDNLKIVTEDYPPYNYMKDGALTGITTEVLNEVLKELNASPKIKLLPWTRAYKMALSEPNVLIYTISRTEERETLFKWAGSVVPAKPKFFKLKSRDDIKISSIDDAKKYTVGGVKDDVSAQYMESQNFTVSYASGYDKNLLKLHKGRIDLLLIDDLSFSFLAKQAGLNVSDFESTIGVDALDVDNSMAFSKTTPDGIVQKFSEALEKVKTSPAYQTILDKYTK